MNDIIKTILAPTGNLPTLYHGTTRDQWTGNTGEPGHLRLTTKLTIAKQCASKAAMAVADKGVLRAEGIVVAFTPKRLVELLALGYALEADPAYLRDKYLRVNFGVQEITSRAWQYSLTGSHGVVISGFLPHHKAGLKVMNADSAVEVGHEEVVPYPVLSTATCLEDLQLELDRALRQLVLEATHFRTSGGSSINLTRALNLANALRLAIDSVIAERRALATRIARKILDANDDEHALDAEVQAWCDTSASAINIGGMQSQIEYLLGLGRTEAEIQKAACLQQAPV